LQTNHCASSQENKTENEIDALHQQVFTKKHRGKETLFVKCIIQKKDIQLKLENFGNKHLYNQCDRIAQFSDPKIH